MVSSIHKFSKTEIDWGLEYAKGEYGLDLDPVLLWVFATSIRKRMATQKRPFDDIRTDLLDWAYDTEFMRCDNKQRVQDTRDAYSGTLGKMFNNRKNVRHVNFSPTERVAPKSTKPRTITRESGQREVKL